MSPTTSAPTVTPEEGSMLLVIVGAAGGGLILLAGAVVLYMKKPASGNGNAMIPTTSSVSLGAAMGSPSAPIAPLAMPAIEEPASGYYTPSWAKK
jgi:hypothetical protein